jgi:hypothetical protein
VDVWFHESGKIQRCAPGHSVFWTYRAWDQPSERKAKKCIEDSFQALADAILGGKHRLAPDDHAVVARFQQLWAQRFGIKEFLPADIKVPGVAPPEQEHSQAQQENLEANGYSFATGNRMLGPQVAGLMIEVGLLRLARSGAASTEWSVVTSSQIEFLVPDSYRTVRTVPLSPNCCLIAIPGGPREFSPQETMHINNMAARQCVRHAFARDFSKTGVVFHPPGFMLSTASGWGAN